MQTHFSPEQLRHPKFAESDRILRTCVHCGFCTATCPTYLLTGDELDSPRGRIYLAKDMLEKNRPADATTVKHLDRCLTCLACMTTCPSGVHYMHLVDHARQHIEQTYRRPLADRLLRSVLASVLPYTRRFSFSLKAAALVQPLRRIFPRRMRALLEAARADAGPRPRVTKEFRSRAPSPSPQVAEHGIKRVALLPGCVQPALRPEINEATVRLLNRFGVEVVVAKGTGCCGALVHHLGREHQAHAQAKADIDAWIREIEGPGLDAIIVTASGCGTMLKDYGFIFRTDSVYAEKAQRVSALARDVTEVLARVMPPAGTAGHSGGEKPAGAPAAANLPRVAYHSACSLQHGQKLHTLPRDLLRQAGFTVLDVPEGHVCCGSAGTYSLLQPEMSAQLRERKARNIESVKPDVIATGNIGCMTQIGQATEIPIVHTVELLDWATGGPCPARLQR
jgi:glycolate oxidase iron-sulfur subunit